MPASCRRRRRGRVFEETRECLADILGSFLKKRASGSRNFWKGS